MNERDAALSLAAGCKRAAALSLAAGCKACGRDLAPYRPNKQACGTACRMAYSRGKRASPYQLAAASLARAAGVPFNDLWKTPGWVVIQAAELVGRPFVLDAAAQPWDAYAPAFLAPKEDALALGTRWADHADPSAGGVWLNPPYSGGIGAWLHKACNEAHRDGWTVALHVPASTSASWFRQATEELDAPWWLYRRRVAYLDPVTGEPARSPRHAPALILLGPTEQPAGFRGFLEEPEAPAATMRGGSCSWCGARPDHDYRRDRHWWAPMTSRELWRYCPRCPTAPTWGPASSAICAALDGP